MRWSFTSFSCFLFFLSSLSGPVRRYEFIYNFTRNKYRNIHIPSVVIYNLYIQQIQSYTSFTKKVNHLHSFGMCYVFHVFHEAIECALKVEKHI